MIRVSLVFFLDVGQQPIDQEFSDGDQFDFLIDEVVEEVQDAVEQNIMLFYMIFESMSLLITLFALIPLTISLSSESHFGAFLLEFLTEIRRI